MNNDISIKTLKIVLITLSSIAVVLGIIDLIIIINNHSSGDSLPTLSETNNTRSNNKYNNLLSEDGAIIKEKLQPYLESLNKDDALEIASMALDDKNHLPKGFLPEEAKLKSNEFTYELLYSYDDINEIIPIAVDSVMGLGEGFLDRRSADDFIVNQISPYLAVVSMNNDKIPCDELDESGSSILCYRGFSFNRQYLNSYEKIEGNSHNDVVEIIDKSPDFLKYALPVIYVSGSYGNNIHSLFGYYFEETPEKLSLVTVHFGVGYDLESFETASSLESLKYAVNVYSMELNVDKNTGELNWTRYDHDSRMKNLRTFIISEKEAIPFLSV